MEVNLLELSATAIKLYLVLKCYEDKEGKCFPGQELLKNKMGFTRSSQLRDARKELLSRGLIKYSKKYTTEISAKGYRFQRPQGYYMLVKCKTHITTKDSTSNLNVFFIACKVQNGTVPECTCNYALLMLAKENISQEVNIVENNTIQALSEFLGDSFKYEQGIAYRKTKSGWQKINNPAAYLAKIETENKNKSNNKSSNYKSKQTEIDPTSLELREYQDEKGIWHFPIITNGKKTGEKLIPPEKFIAYINGGRKSL